MSWNTLDELKTNLKRSGFGHKAILDAADMEKAVKLIDQDPRVIETPGEELRYVEGLFNLPLGYLKSFKVVPQSGCERCECGRVPSALDIIHFAFVKQIHSRELIRDTLIGFANVFEMSDGGRATECYQCGRTLIMARYTRKSSYMYA